MKILVAGGGGFIGSHVAKRLKAEGHYLLVADIQRNIYIPEAEFCDEFHLHDLRDLNNCLRSCEGCEWVFNLAADMGGMGFIQSNNASILYNNVMISFNMMEAARRQGCKRFFYTSSACVYPEHKQVCTSTSTATSTSLRVHARTLSFCASLPSDSQPRSSTARSQQPWLA